MNPAILLSARMVVLTKKLKTFKIEFRDPSKVFYRSGDKVSGSVVVEVSDITKVKAVRVYGIGCAKVEYHKGKQRCRDEIDYLRYEDALHLDQQPTGEGATVWAVAQF